jgi:hypothetical protein
MVYVCMWKFFQSVFWYITIIVGIVLAEIH